MRYVITGGAGFIGSNFASMLARRGDEVAVFDDLSRKGSERNLSRLRRASPAVRFIRGDVRRPPRELSDAVRSADVVFHLAAQVGVPSSVADPAGDFAINALGTLQMLELVRNALRPPAFLFASTNKVYGHLEDRVVTCADGSYGLAGSGRGVDESVPVSPVSPYGCSKACGDQYVRDYAKIYGLKTAVIRQSCIYGPGQNGSEEQGWVAWLMIAAALELPVTLYGSGRQVRDLLHVQDLFLLWDRITLNPELLCGEVFNAGGGAASALSIREAIPRVEALMGSRISVSSAPARPGDQPVFIADTAKAERLAGWRPLVGVEAGMGELAAWVSASRTYFASLYRGYAARAA